MKFTYTVTSLDLENKLLDVDFGDGGWARIPLTLPFPTSQAELDAIVRPYVASTSQIRAAQADAASLAFVQGLIGKTAETEREERKPGEVPPAEPLTPEQQLAVRKSAIDRQRDEKIAAGFVWNGETWYADPTFQAQVTGRVTQWNVGNYPMDLTKPVRAKSGAVHMLGFEAHKTLGLALDAHVEAIYVWSWAEKAKLEG